MTTIEKWLNLHKQEYAKVRIYSPRDETVYTAFLEFSGDVYLEADGVTIADALEALDDKLGAEAGALLATATKDLDEG